LSRSRPELIAENAFLRQQVIVLKRQHTGRLQSHSTIGACWWGWPADCTVGRMHCISSSRIPCSWRKQLELA
jgi:hypothetical protein